MTAGSSPLTDPAFAFGPAQLQTLARDGFLQLPTPLLSPAGLEHCRGHVERMLGELQPGRNPTAIYNAHQRPGGEWLCALATEPAVVAMVTAQIGADAVLWNSDLVLKPPAGGEEEAIPYHQDHPYHGFRAAEAASLWLTLDDVDEHCGTMCVEASSLRMRRCCLSAAAAGQVRAPRLAQARRAAAPIREAIGLHRQGPRVQHRDRSSRPATQPGRGRATVPAPRGAGGSP
eukprot:COSAG04_NODE_2933_length_3374_cov_1.692824_2_plen_231_part_00